MIKRLQSKVILPTWSGKQEKQVQDFYSKRPKKAKNESKI